MHSRIRLQAIPEKFAICKLPPKARIPTWAMSGKFWSVTRTATELSVVCEQSRVPSRAAAERNWRILQVVGPLPFEMVGVLSSLTSPLAKGGLSIFAISTFETDLLLVREESLEKACRILEKAGHMVFGCQ